MRQNRAIKISVWMYFLCLCPLVFALGCGDEENKAGEEKAPPPGVNLPETPILVTQPIKVHAAEGVYTVAGVFEFSEEEMGKTVSVRGVVASREICDSELEDEEIFCPTPPHLVLVDSLVTPGKQMKVVGTLEQIRAVEDGAEPITVVGKLQQWNDDEEDLTYDKFFVDSDGLIQLLKPPPESMEID